MIDEFEHRKLMAKMDMIIEFLEKHGGIGHEMYSLTCCMSGEEVSFDIVDVAIDVKDKIDCKYQASLNDDLFPF